MITTFLLCLAFAAVQEIDQYSEKPTADSIIARYVDAKGGKSRLLRVQNYRIAGSIEVVNGEERMALAKFEVFQADGRSHTQITFPDGTVMSHGTDGKIAWSVSEHGTASVLEGQEARDFIRHHKTLHESLAWRDQFKTIRYVGKKTIDDVETDHVIFVSADNRQINRYFASKDGLLIQEEQFVGPKNSFQVAKFSDYRPSSDGTLVSRQKTIIGDATWGARTEYQIKEVKSNLDDIDQYLKVPESVSQLLRKSNAE